MCTAVLAALCLWPLLSWSEPTKDPKEIAQSELFLVLLFRFDCSIVAAAVGVQLWGREPYAWSPDLTAPAPRSLPHFRPRRRPHLQEWRLPARRQLHDRSGGSEQQLRRVHLPRRLGWR